MVSFRPPCLPPLTGLVLLAEPCQALSDDLVLPGLSLALGSVELLFGFHGCHTPDVI